MRDRESSRPHRRKSRPESSNGNPTRLWIRIAAGGIAIVGLIGAILKFVDREKKPEPVSPTASAPVAPSPASTPGSPPAPTTSRKNSPVASDPPTPVRNTSRQVPPAAKELIATIVQVREVTSQIQSKPFDLVVEYDYGGSVSKPYVDAVVFTTSTTGAGAPIDDTASKGSFRFTPDPVAQFDGESRFWIERQEVGKPRQRISNVYTLKR